MVGNYDKLKGTLYGQAIGDALGLGTEFMTLGDINTNYPNGYHCYDDIIQDGHRQQWVRGEWTDDTEMMLCIAKAIIEDKSINLFNIAQKFKEWADNNPRGIGNHMDYVLGFEDYIVNPYEISEYVWNEEHQTSASNGGLMRTSVVGLLPNDVEQCAANICKLTHYDPRCVGSCVIVSELIHSLVYDKPVLSYEQMIKMGNKYDNRIKEYIELSKTDDIHTLNLQERESWGYTLKSLACGLWVYWHCSSFKEGLLTVVRAGGDADTNAAVTSAILGAKYGYSSIPSQYIDGLFQRELLEEIIDLFYEFIKNKNN